MIRTQPKAEAERLIAQRAFEEGLNRGLQMATMHARLQIVALTLHLPTFLVEADAAWVAVNLQHLMAALTQFEREHTL